MNGPVSNSAWMGFPNQRRMVLKLAISQTGLTTSSSYSDEKGAGLVQSFYGKKGSTLN